MATRHFGIEYGCGHYDSILFQSRVRETANIRMQLATGNSIFNRAGFFSFDIDDLLIIIKKTRAIYYPELDGDTLQRHAMIRDANPQRAGEMLFCFLISGTR